MKTLEDMKIQLDRIEKNQFDLVAAADRLWQSHAALEIKIESGLRGTADGVALAIAELRKDLGKPREVEPLRLSDDMHTLFMDLLDELRVTRFALATRSASPLGGKARSGTKRKHAARRTRK